ncbi:MAG: UDP-N-acetylmuramoyl-tripeptide--D-alanyl-D-alanine ligase [Pseudomonadota bacterium]
MKIIWTSRSLSEALQVEVPHDIQTSILQFNSKDVNEGDLFIALMGQSDGHLYAKDALLRGAAAIIIDHEVDDIDKSKVIMVKDTEAALLDLAKYKRNHSKAKFIAVTGSAGKTSTKDAIYKILQKFGQSFASRGTFNNHLGVPLNLASIPDDTEYAILEIGMNNPGEITPLSILTKPDIAIITNVLPVHLGQFSSLRDIADAKCEIFAGMEQGGVEQGGIVLLNKGNEFYEYCASEAGSHNIYSFGAAEGADARLASYSFDGTESHLEFLVLGKKVEASTKLAGKHMAENLAAGLMVAEIWKLDLDKAAIAISELSPLKGRGEILHIKISGHNCDIIYDCYNANPSSVQSALMHMKDVNHENKIVILGDMLELGTDAAEYHKALAPFVIASGARTLYTVGDLMHNLHRDLKNTIKCKHFTNSEDLQQSFPELVNQDSLILFKASKSMKLSNVVEDLSLKD